MARERPVIGRWLATVWPLAKGTIAIHSPMIGPISAAWDAGGVERSWALACNLFPKMGGRPCYSFCATRVWRHTGTSSWCNPTRQI
uniref:Putative secreted protein n=1 Tax=Ixodes ricinus TaxID=34613 RepID=A0A6B0U152_IXORI